MNTRTGANKRAGTLGWQIAAIVLALALTSLLSLTPLARADDGGDMSATGMPESGEVTEPIDSGRPERTHVYMSSDVVSVRLPGELGDQLGELAQRPHRSKAFYVREAVAAHQDEISDYYLAAELSRQVASGELGTDSRDELRAELGAERDPARDDELLEPVQ